MDGFQGFTITSSQGVQIPVNLVLGADNASAKIEALIADLQKKCRLTLTINTEAVESALNRLQALQDSIGRSGSSVRSRGTSRNNGEEDNVAFRYTALMRQRDRMISSPYTQNVEKYEAAIDIARQKLAQGFTIPGVQDAINNLQRLLEQYQETGEGANALKVASDALSTALRNEASAAKRAREAANRPPKETKQPVRVSASPEEVLAKRLQSFDNAAQRMRLRLGDLGDGKTTAEYERFVSLLDQVRKNGGKGFEQLASASIDAQHSIQNLNKELREAQNLARLRQDLTSKLTPEWFSNQQGRLNTQFANADPAMVANVQAALDKLREFRDVASLSDDQIKSCAAALEQYNQKVAEAGANNTFTKSAQEQATAIANLKAQYEDYMSKYGQNLSRNIPLMQKFRKLGEDLSSGMGEKEARQQFAALREEAKKSGVEVETVRQRMNRLFGQHFNTALIMLAIRGLRMALRQLWQDIKEVNEALVQTQIVTGLSGAALEAYTDKAYAAAEKSRDKITNILSESTAYGRLGYDSELSVQLAQLTSMYSKLGDVDTSDATDAITALMKAFDLKDADEIELALDKMIYVGNNFPISAAGLGEGLNNAASALSSAGNSLEQTLALLMAANATVQNPSKSSTAMRTITARIRNTKAELDELGEELDEKYDTVAKYQKELLGLTGVDILDATGKNFRATYDILKDLAGVWSTLSSAQQAAVTTMLAGTRNQDIFASLMKNFPSAEDAMSGMDDAAGLMDEKFKAVEGSISGALSGLSNAWSKFSNTLVNSGDITAFVKMITGMVKALTGLTKVFGGGTLITGVLSLITLFSKFRQFGQIYPQMQSVITTLSGNHGLHNVLLDSGQIQTAVTALSGYTNAQQRVIMSQAGMSVAAQKQVLEYQGMSTAALGASGATSTLAASMDGLKAKMTAFVQSGNLWIMIIQALIMLFTFGINKYRQWEQAQAQAAEEAKRRAQEAQEAARDSVDATKSALDTLNQSGQSASDYRDRLSELADRLEAAVVGSNDYKDAKLELYEVQQDIINQFGIESGAIRGVSEDLRDYANRLDEIEEKKKYLSLFEGENYAGTLNALQWFGVTPEGGSTQSSGRIALDNITLQVRYQAVYDKNLGAIFNYQDAQRAGIKNAVASLLGEDLMNYVTQYGMDYRDNSRRAYRALSLNGSSSRMGDVYETYDLSSITLSGDAREILRLLNTRLQDIRDRMADPSYAAWNDEYQEQARYLSGLISAFKEQTGYQSAEEIFQTWATGQIKYGTASGDLLNPYNNIVLNRDAYLQSVATGDASGAQFYLGEMLNAVNQFNSIAEEKGYEWGESFTSGLMNALDGGFTNAEFLKHLADGVLFDANDSVYVLKNAFGARDFSNTTADLIKRAGQYEDANTAALDGMWEEYFLFQKLSSVAKYYGMTLDEVLNYLTMLYNLPSGFDELAPDMSFSTFHNNPGSGLDVEDPFTNESVLGATESVSKVKSASDKLFDAEATRDRIKEAFDSGAEVAQEDIDAIKEYVGDTFDEIDEDVIASIDETLGESRDEISTSIEGLANNAIEWMQENVEGFNLADYIDTDGNIDFSGIIAAFQNSGVENAAGAAGANASMSYLSNLQTVGGASIRARLTEDGLGYVTEFSGGTASDTTTTKPRGGGGGGHHSQISDDIENVERLIKLFKELLNYYDEGSEQWIARQRQIIDKYKAGVEIAMAEYDRLIKKGLKQTDDDVKKIVDTILEYQGDIFEESKKLWEAVRQNQIDAIKHTKDQNDAAIELEKTHHDLLISIRNERRELEDELKAARDAYSEVMTPEELDALFSAEDFATLMDKLAGIEGDAMKLYRDYREQIAAVSEDETYMIEHITDEFKRQYDLKMKEYEIAKAELGVARAQQELENVKNEQTVMMLIGGRWQWVADPEKVLEAEQKLADAEQELADAQDEYDFQSLIHTMEAQSSEYQRQIDALEALTFSMDELAEQIHLFSDSVYKELLSYLSQIAQNIFDKYDGDTAIPAFAEGGVIKRSGLATVHSGEPIFSTADAAKLWRFVHDLGDAPVNTNGVYSGITSKLISANPEVFGGASPVSIDNSINIPGGIHVHGEMAQQLITLLKEVVAPYNPNA